MEDFEKNKIIIVEDDELARKAYNRQLTKFDYIVIEREDGQGIEALIEESKPDLILLDFRLPESSGLDILKAIRKTHSPLELPVIMITNYDAGLIQEAFTLGANDYLPKPLDKLLAIHRIAAHIGFCHLNRAAIKKEEVSTFHNLVVTYNHHINNALSNSLGFVKAFRKDQNLSHLDKVESNLTKIHDFLKKIAKCSEEQIDESIQYGASKLYKPS